MPYARFLQMARVTAEAELREQENQYRVVAYGAWLHYLMQPTSTGYVKMGLKEWIDHTVPKVSNALRLKLPKMSEEDKVETIKKANEAQAKVIDMFKRKNVKALKVKKRG